MAGDTLTYRIAAELLTGKIDGKSFQLRAASGGRRGRAHDRSSLQSLRSWDPGLKLPGISGPVGDLSSARRGGNAPRDVRTVQQILNAWGHRLAVDGLAGPRTIAAITAFQRKLGLARPDGRVDPRGRTLRGLLARVAGGPVPPGRYRLVYKAAHPTFGKCVYLDPLRIDELVPGVTEYKRRNGFFIHGRGDRGSDGCIVPYDPAERKALNEAIAAAKGHVHLDVTDPGIRRDVIEAAVRSSWTV